MSNYFTMFPTTYHSIERNGESVPITNIFKRFRFESSLKDRLDIFYPYRIQDGDRPDTLAEKYYGNPNYAWVIILFNNIIDPLAEWPKEEGVFKTHIEAKYGSIPNAKQQVHEYRLILYSARRLYSGRIIPKRTITIDLETYNSTPVIDREMITKWDHEVKMNDDRREIKILDKRYLSQLQDEVEDILRDGTGTR